MTMQTIKRWFMFCEPCGFRKIIKLEGSEAEELTEVKRVDVPGGAPKLDPVKKKTVYRDSVSTTKMFKCLECGRGCVCKKLPDVYAKAYKSVDDKVRMEKEEADKQQRIDDGTPIKRVGGEDYDKDMGFMG